MRTDQHQERLQVKLDRFPDTMGREPTWKERCGSTGSGVRLRPTKPHALPEGELHQRWRAELTEVGVDPVELIAEVGGTPTPAAVELTPLNRRYRCRRMTSCPQYRGRRGWMSALQVVMVRMAVGELVASRSSWRRNDVVRELAPSATRHPRPAPSADVVARVEHLADRTGVERWWSSVPRPPRGCAPARTADRSTNRRLQRRLTVERSWPKKMFLVCWATNRWEAGGHPLVVPVNELDRAQAAAAAAVAGTAPLVTVLGPAGVGEDDHAASGRGHLDRSRPGGVRRGPYRHKRRGGAVDGDGHAADTIDKFLQSTRGPRVPRSGACRRGRLSSWTRAGMVTTPKLAALGPSGRRAPVAGDVGG